MAVDFNAVGTGGPGLLWFRNVTANGYWNSNSAANPAAGTGGFSLSLNGDVTGVIQYLIIGAGLGTNFVSPYGTTATATFGGPFVGTVPAGFTGWGEPTRIGGYPRIIKGYKLH
jgi:hypothetical protein